MRLRIPRIDYAYAHGVKVAEIPCHDGHAMDQSSRGDECITIGARIRNVQGPATLCDSRIYRQNAPRECRQDVPVHPSTKNGALCLVSPFDEKNPDL